MAATTSRNDSRPQPWRPWVLAAIGVLAVLLAYARVRNADFIWDDDSHVTSNPTIIGPLGLKEIWTSGKANYFPLTMTSFWVQHQLWGLAPAPYHIVSVLFHAAGTLLLWQVLRRLNVPGAWLGAMLWALHPVQAESVAWISELKNTQSGFFYLLAVLFFVRWMQGGAPLRFSRDYAIALTAAVLAILSKSSTVMLPVVLGLIGWWCGHRRWRDVVWLAPFLVVSLIASGWTIWEQKVNSMASGPEWGHGLASRLMIAGKVPWFYLGKLLWPEPLVFIYPRWDVNALGVPHWIPLLGTIALGVIVWRCREGRGQPLFIALGYFFVSLFPVLGLFDVFFFRYSFVGDHFQYLASMGPLVLIGAGVAILTGRYSTARWAATVVPLGALGFLTWKQVGIYLNREALWRDTVELNPKAWIARVNLSAELMSTGQSALAIPHYEAALRLKPNDPLTEANWGAALIQLGRIDEAITHLDRSVRLKPDLASAHDSLCVALASAGRLDEAIAHGETGVKLMPDLATAWQNLANAMIRSGRLNDALQQLEAGLRISPGSASLQNSIAAVLLLMGRRDEAIERYRGVVRLSPQDFEALQALTELMMQKGAYVEALDYGAAALRLRPDSPECRFAVGNALSLIGRPADAIAHYEHALRVRPDYVDARGNLGSALYQTGRFAEAMPHFEAVARVQPNSPGANNNLGSALMKTGRLVEAIDYFRRAVALAPDYVDARANLALALEAADHLDDAIAQWHEVGRLNPQRKDASEQVKRLQLKRSPASQKP